MDEYQNNNEYNNYEEDHEDYESPQPSSLTRQQKIATAGLAIFAFFIVILWAAQFKSSLSSPFVYDSSSDDTEETTCTSGNCSETDENLTNKDTDKDGLSDYDELNTYETSPYLEDSDSDGYSDLEEIQNSKDPNCPAGQDCYSNSLVSGDSTTDTSDNSLSDLLNDINYSSSDSASLDTTAATDVTDVLGQMDADTLRQLLLDNGMDETILNQISDEQLIASFNQILSEE